MEHIVIRMSGKEKVQYDRCQEKRRWNNIGVRKRVKAKCRKLMKCGFSREDFRGKMIEKNNHLITMGDCEKQELLKEKNGDCERPDCSKKKQKGLGKLCCEFCCSLLFSAAICTFTMVVGLFVVMKIFPSLFFTNVQICLSYPPNDDLCFSQEIGGVAALD